MEQAIFNWFLNMRSQNVPLSAYMIQQKLVIFAQRIEHWKLSGFMWLATTLKGKK